MAGDVTYYDPGKDPDATLVANANGNVAERGDAVQIVGENSQGTEVALVETAGEGVGILKNEPDEYDPDDTFAAGDEVGECAVRTRAGIDWYPDGGNAHAAGDLVVADVGGSVRTYDSAGGDTPEMIEGRVWTTLQRGQHTTGKVAVLRR